MVSALILYLLKAPTSSSAIFHKERSQLCPSTRPAKYLFRNAGKMTDLLQSHCHVLLLHLSITLEVTFCLSAVVCFPAFTICLVYCICLSLTGNNDLVKMFFLCVSHTKDNIVKSICADPHKMMKKMLYCACQASSWRCDCKETLRSCIHIHTNV